MVVGEPGIGKTALVEQLATYVSLRGGRTLVGHCYEEGSLSLPYLAFVEAMRSYVLAREPEALKSDLGTGAADVARIVSEIRDRMQVELRPAGDPEDDRWWLLQAVSGFLRNAANVQPLLIVVEDLHWADRGTLDLLLHVARNLQGARLTIVGTYRDVEVDRTHPLSSALADLSRAASFVRVRLRGLTVDEVLRMISNIRGQEVSWGRAEMYYRQTEGNPLFIQELLRYLVEEGLVVREGGRYALADPSQPEAGVPEGLRDVIGKRLSRLSPECNRLLSVAAVVGRDFNLETLRAVTTVEEEALLAALEEAVRVGVLEERSQPGRVHYRFAHAFFRQTLYEEMIAPRRLRLHQEIARALEAQYGNRREEHATELAEYFAQSTDMADLARAVEYGELAAQRAMSVFDYGEAARLLERALQVQEVLDPDNKAKRCNLLLSLGEALMPTRGWNHVIDNLGPEAFSLAESIGDRARASRVCRLVRFALQREGGGTTEGTPTSALWAERGDRLAAPGTLDRVWADIALAREASADVSVEGLRQYVRRALALALELHDPDSTVQSLTMSYPLANNSPRQLDEIADLLPLFRQYLESDLIGVNLAAKAVFFLNCFRLFLWNGERELAERAFARGIELADHTNDRLAHAIVGIMDQRLKFLDGALVGLVEAGALPGEAGFGEGSGRSLALAAWFYTGGEKPPEPQARSEGTLALAGYLFAHARWSLIQGNRTAAIEDFRRLVAMRGDLAGASIAGRLDLAIRLEVDDLVTAQYQTAKSLAPMPGVNVQNSNPYVLQVVMGDAALYLGNTEEARQHYEAGLQVALRVRNRPFVALARAGLAELLLEHYPDERAEPLDHLDFAISEFREMKMQPSLERALRHRGLLKA